MLKTLKVAVGGKNSQIMFLGKGADQEVGVRSLHALSTAGVEKFGRALVVAGFDRQVGKSAERVTQ